MTRPATLDRPSFTWSGRPLTHDLAAPDAVIVGIVVHRGDDAHLAQSVASLVGQSRPLDGIVVAHVGTTQPPAWICDRFPDVRVLAASGSVSTAALVEGIVAALPADGYLFQEATDWSAPTRLEQLLVAVRDEHAALVGSDYVLVVPEIPDAHTRTMPTDGNAAFESGTGGSVIEPYTMLVDGNLVERLGGFNTGLSVGAGNEFAARAAVISRILNIPRVLYFSRKHDSSDWSSSTAGPSLSERIVFAALGERSRVHALSIARRQTPDVAMHTRRRPPTVLLVAGPSIVEPARPSGVELARAEPEANEGNDREIGRQFGRRAFAERDHPSVYWDDSPVFIVSASESLSRFIACALGQHPRLLTVEVSEWMTEIAQLSARYILAGRQNASRGAAMPTRSDAVYRAASAAVDALFVGGHGSRDNGGRGAQPDQRWVGAVRADSATLSAAALLYPDAKFLHVARDVDAAVAAEIRVQDDSDIEDLYRSWLTATQAILDLGQMLESGRMRTIHYEQLVACPDAVIDRWLDLLGEDTEPACAAFVAPGSSGADYRATIADLAGIPAQLEARRLSIALSGTSTGGPSAARSDALAKILTNGTTEVNRRRRATDIREDDRNPYAAAHDLVRRSAPKHAIVCVVSKGDEMAVRIRGHALGWHFPQASDGSYVGYHPKDAREAIAHLEHLRDRGATLFLVPSVYLWWLQHYDELRQHLERTYERIPDDDGQGALWDLRPANMRAAEPWGVKS